MITAASYSRWCCHAHGQQPLLVSEIYQVTNFGPDCPEKCISQRLYCQLAMPQSKAALLFPEWYP